MPIYEYDIAISYADEDRSYVDALVPALESRGIRFFYDKFEVHNLWGKNLIEYLYDVYSKKARYCVVLVSRYYVKPEKVWTRHERKSAQERALHQESEYLLPIRLDDTSVPGLPDTVCYIRFKDYTVDEIADLVLRKLGVPSRDAMPIDTISPTPSLEEAKLHEATFNPTQDLRFIRHENLTAKLLPSKNEYGYYALHSFAVPKIDISDQRLQDTFLNTNRAYSESLFHASPPDVHPDGYTRRFEIRGKSSGRITTQATTCYFDGHIVAEGYLDEFCESKDGFNPNWFLYEIQRHLQLTKEVFEGFTTKPIFTVIFQDIGRFKWEIYRYGKIWQEKPYVGYHKNIVLPVELSGIHGRDKWNIKMKIAEDIMIRIARMFGMDKLPQPYWNETEVLDYPHGIPTR